MVYYYFYPEVIVLSLLVIVNSVVVYQLYNQIKKQTDNRRWKYLRVWLFVCFDIGMFLIILANIQANSPLQNQNVDILFYAGIYFLFSGTAIAAYLTMELANLHKNKDSNPKILYITLALLWIPAMAVEVYKCIVGTVMAKLIRQIIEALHIILLGVIFISYGCSLLHQLRKSQVLSKKTTALKKLSSMLLVAGVVAISVICVNFGLSTNEVAGVWCTFVLEVTLNILFICVLGPSIVIVPFKAKKFRPFWKPVNKDVSPNKRENLDSLSDAFATPSTEPESTTLSLQSYSQSRDSSQSATPNESQSKIEVNIEMDTIERGEKQFNYEKKDLSETEKEHDFEFTEKLEQVNLSLSQEAKVKAMTLQTPNNEETLGDSQLTITIDIVD